MKKYLPIHKSSAKIRPPNAVNASVNANVNVNVIKKAVIKKFR